jgi:hypothetical protein
MINSRCDAFKVWSGPLFKSIENYVYEHIPFFIKHVPVPDRPALIMALKRAGVYFYATDFTAYESHFTPEFMDICECQLYRHLLGHSVDSEFLCKTIMGDNRMRTRSGCRARVKGRRMSGDMCTSLGNGFTNLMLVLFLAAEKKGQVTGYVEGDDGIFASTVPLTSDDYSRLGFTIKIEQVSDPCEASFCGMIFTESGQIIRDPVKVLMGFGWTGSFINAGQEIMDQLLRAKALSGVYETGQCPIAGALYRYALAQTVGVCPRFVSDGFHQVPRDTNTLEAFNPSPTTRALFSKLYGISESCQIQVEKSILSGDFDTVASLLPAPPEVAQYFDNYVVAA